MRDERLDKSIGLCAPAALLHSGILTDEEAEREIRTPLLDRLDHGEAAAGRRSVQQRRAELHRVLRHVRHKALHVGHGKDGADRGPRAVPLRYVWRDKPAGPADEGLQRVLQHRWVPRVVVEKLIRDSPIARYQEGFGERPQIEVEQIRELVLGLDEGDDGGDWRFSGKLHSNFEKESKMPEEKTVRGFGLGGS